ncbi:MAG: sulfotransferase domain-containing protein [Deltaproteobacteria bacterium]|nr:sulfotransferase domain-containing protein [Deltaproteobacteria bacterium]
MKNRVYILSTGRAGTTFLFNIFNTINSELSLTHQKRWSRTINILGNIPLPINCQIKIIYHFFKNIKNESIPLSTVDPLLSLSIFILIKNGIIKNPKVVHLVRDPRDFVTSFMNWKSQSFSKKILHNLIPFWQPFPRGKGLSFFHWIFMSKFEKFCWTWYYKNYLFKQLEGKTNYKLIKMENLTKGYNSKANVKTLARFCGLGKKEFDYEQITSHSTNKSITKCFPSYNNWSAKKQNTLKRICGELMIDFGYQL